MRPSPAASGASVRNSDAAAAGSQRPTASLATDPSAPVHDSSSGGEESPSMVTRADAERMGKDQPLPVTFQ